MASPELGAAFDLTDYEDGADQYMSVRRFLDPVHDYSKPTRRARVVFVEKTCTR